MQRKQIQPRNNWQSKTEEYGLHYHTIENEIYWDESACYEFTLDEVDLIEDSTNELHEMCITAVKHVIENRLYEELGIPSLAVKLIEDSWQDGAPSLYGRFDFSYNGSAPPKMLEYNADTPTSLLEASVIQWFWLKDCYPEADQFNSIHEKLVDAWGRLKKRFSDNMYFSCVKESVEDAGNIDYLMDTAIQAGINARFIHVEDIGFDSLSRVFVDLSDEQIKTIFKLYPWEWLVSESFGKNLAESRINIIEPAWKIILSNKAILPVLWQLFPDHPNLLEASFDKQHFKDNFVSKPFFSREGANISLTRNGSITSYEGSYTSSKKIYQTLATLPCFDGNYPVIGSWIINGEAAGIGIREDHNIVTSNSSRFVPHIIK